MLFLSFCGFAGPVAAVEYVPRHQRLGLGATPKPPEAPQKKYIKPGETREAKPDLVYRDEHGEG